MHSSVPTFAHYLRQLNYQTILAGKMDFSGPGTPAHAHTRSVWTKRHVS